MKEGLLTMAALLTSVLWAARMVGTETLYRAEPIPTNTVQQSGEEF